ncbi:hypothetical protein FKM82_022653, partial [Ascaphus truei]
QFSAPVARNPLPSYCTRFPFQAAQDRTPLRASAASSPSTNSSPEKPSSLLFHQLPASRSIGQHSSHCRSSPIQAPRQSFLYSSESPSSRQQKNIFSFTASSPSTRDPHSVSATTVPSRQKDCQQSAASPPHSSQLTRRLDCRTASPNLALREENPHSSPHCGPVNCQLSRLPS